MGRVNDVLHHYLDDAERFADLYNGIFFAGKPIIDAKELTEAEESYYDVKLQEVSGDCREIKKSRRSRDLKKYLKSGSTLRILAIENQNQVDYSMPFRCMEYDTLEYRKQLEELKKKNANVYNINRQWKMRNASSTVELSNFISWQAFE